MVMMSLPAAADDDDDNDAEEEDKDDDDDDEVGVHFVYLLLQFYQIQIWSFILKEWKDFNKLK